MTNENKGSLTVFVGLPGSGKSTRAQELLATLPGASYLNRDLERERQFGVEYVTQKPEGKKEFVITRILENRLRKALREGRPAIDDNTNADRRDLDRLLSIAREFDAPVTVIPVDVSVEEAKRRNRLRGEGGGRLVPEEVIDAMAKKLYDGDLMREIIITEERAYYLPRDTEQKRLLAEFNEKLSERYPVISKEKVVLVDFDGTLAHNAEALEKYVRGEGVKKQWKRYFNAKAPMNESVGVYLHELREKGYTIFLLTGRQDDVAPSVISAVERYGVPVSRVLMGRMGDFRGDYRVKSDVLTSLVEEGYRIVASIDDRPSSIAVWEENDIPVARVPESVRDEEGNFAEPQVIRLELP